MPLPTYFPYGYFGPGLPTPPAPVTGPSTALYTYITFGQLCDELAVRLGDPDNVFWTDEELCLYIKDALRHWNLLAQYHKERVVFYTVPGQAFYTLPTAIPTQRSYSIVDSDVIKIMQYHLMEPATGTSWTGTEQFTFQTVTDSVNRIANRLLLDTGCKLQVDTFNSGPPPVSRISLDDDIIDVRRAAWKDTTPWYRNLRRRDGSSRRSFSPRSDYTPGSPKSYIISSLPHVSVELSPPSIDAGRIELITARSQPTVDGSGVVLQVPDDFTPTLKWGILADLLSTERAQDSDRAAYCEQRWQEGIEAAKLAPSVQFVQVNGKPVALTSLIGLDNYRPNWENESGEPLGVGLAGLDFLALAPVPDDIYSITVDVVRKAIMPVDDLDYIQIGREFKDAILDYCVHIASFKQGGSTFTGTKPLLDNFLETAMLYNKRLKAQSQNLEAITAYPVREEQNRPREGTLAMPVPVLSIRR